MMRTLLIIVYIEESNDEILLITIEDKEQVDHVSNLTPLNFNPFITMGYGNIL